MLERLYLWVEWTWMPTQIRKTEKVENFLSSSPEFPSWGCVGEKIRQTQVLIDCKCVKINEIIFISNKTT